MCIGGWWVDMSGLICAVAAAAAAEAGEGWTLGPEGVAPDAVGAELGVGSNGGADDVIGRRCMAISPCWMRASCCMFCVPVFPEEEEEVEEQMFGNKFDMHLST